MNEKETVKSHIIDIEDRGFRYFIHSTLNVDFFSLTLSIGSMSLTDTHTGNVKYLDDKTNKQKRICSLIKKSG